MSTARLSNIGYMMLSKETAPGVAVAPAIAIPLYDESLNTDGGFQDLEPAFGTKFATYQTLPGTRSHKGSVTCLFEANTAAHLFNGLLTIGSSSNAGGVYTYPYTLGSTTGSYTIDISMGGNIVKRFIGAQFSEISPSWNKNEAQAKVSISALGSLEAREITSMSGSGPFVITLNDPNGVFDGNPTRGFVTGDLIRFYKVSSATSVADCAITAITNTTITCTLSTGSMTGIGSGDAVHLRPATPSFNNVQPFMWDKTRFCFGATATAALAASHTPVESGSTWTIKHNFADDNGADRSGSFDPASLDRTIGDIDLTIKKLFDTPEDVVAFKNMNKSACVVRMFAGPTNQYELRITYNALIMDTPVGNLKSGDLIYATEKYHTNMNFTDSQAFDVKVLNALTTV